MLERINNPILMPEETEFDRALRPKTLNDFIGQNQIKQLLDISIKAAKLRENLWITCSFMAPRDWVKPPWPAL